MLNHSAISPLLGSAAMRRDRSPHSSPSSRCSVFCSISYSWSFLLFRETVLYENDCGASWVYKNPREAQLLGTHEKGKSKDSSTFGESNQMASGSSSCCCGKSEGNPKQRNTSDPPPEVPGPSQPRLLAPAG